MTTLQQLYFLPTELLEHLPTVLGRNTTAAAHVTGWAHVHKIPSLFLFLEGGRSSHFFVWCVPCWILEPAMNWKDMLQEGATPKMIGDCYWLGEAVFLARISWHIQYNRPSHISNIYKHIAIITREVWPPIIRRTPRGRHRQTGEICHTFQGRALKGIHQPGAKNGLRPHVVSLAWKTPKENDFPLLSITLSLYIYISILTRSNVRFPIGVIGKGITAK